MTSKRSVSRRQALKVGAAAAALPLVHIRSAGAAGKLSVGVWDHWVPAGNDIMKKQVAEWGEKNKVDVKLDLINTLGNKHLLTSAAEAQAKTGHDVLVFIQWDVHNHARLLEPMDDVVGRLEAKYGKANDICGWLGKVDGQWRAVPSSTGSQNKGPCGRISLLKQHAGLDIKAMYPTQNVQTELANQWTMEAHVKAAEACAKAGVPFAIGTGTTGDSVDTAGSIFASFGAELVNAKGEVKVDSDAVRQALEYGQRLVKALPADAASFDDASNNKALIAGKSALIWNPPSAWAVAKRDAPEVAADCWTFPSPAGPKGRFMPYVPFYWGVWSFSQNKKAGKDFIEWLSEREQPDPRVTASLGYDLPPWQNMTDLKVWDEVGPPTGTVFNYPTRQVHGAKPHIACFPAPPDTAIQIYNRGIMPTMFAKLASGTSINDTIKWAKNELEGLR
jgi:ABC-type glycerol-3-phosphate transport system substrate-binding protein